MAAEGFKRKLTAVFSADVVGYSRLMGEDESATVRTLEGYKGVMYMLIEQHRGRVVDSPGDNLLAEFASVVDAVQCAVAVQKELQARNSNLPENRRMLFRIGINLGDVIEEQERIYGDGVNIAARLEALADPGGICIAKTAFDFIENKLPFGYRFIGEQTVKNIAKPVGAYKVLMEPRVVDDVENEKSKVEAHSKTKSQLPDKPSIAVLPFINMSNDPEQEYFSDGMTEELISALAKLKGLKVISRTSAFYFKGKDVDLSTIGSKLNIENVLEGSVRKAGNKLRITAQLIKVGDDSHLWSETYDRELEDVFAIQEEISLAILENLKVQLLGKEAPKLANAYTENMEAYNLYLEGRFFHGKGPLGYEKAEKSYSKTIDIEPNYAPAYIALAQIYWVSALIFFTPPNEYFPKYMALCNKAIDIDPDFAEAHSALGISKATYEYDWSGAEKSLVHAIDLNPGIPGVHFNYSVYLAARGRMDEAIAAVKRCRELDPYNWEYAHPHGFMLSFARKFDQAMDQTQKTLELAPEDPFRMWPIAMAYAGKGMYDEGISLLQPYGNIPFNAAYLGYLYGKAGKAEEAHKILDDFLEREKKGYFSPQMIAQVYTGLGNNDMAFEWLNKAFEVRDATQIFLKVHPPFADLYSDPRWAEQMKKRGLAD